MTNFIFKSQGLIKNVDNKLEMIQSEQRHQRADLAHLMRMVQTLINDANLQKQVDQYFEDKPEQPPEEVDHL